MVNQVMARDREVSMVFQSFVLYPHLNVRQNLAFGLKMRNVARREIQERIRWAAETLGIDRLLMCITGADHIEQVLSFPIDRA